MLTTANRYLRGLLDIVLFLLRALVAGAYVQRMHYSEGARCIANMSRRFGRLRTNNAFAQYCAV